MFFRSRKGLWVWRGMAFPPEIVVAQEAAVNDIPPVRIVTLEAELHNGLISPHHLSHGFFCWPPKELTHLLLMREAKVFNGAFRIVLDGYGQLSHGVRVQPIALQIHRLHGLVLPQGPRQLDPLCLLQIGVGQSEHLDVRIPPHGIHQLRRNPRLEMRRRHVHISKVELHQSWIVQMSPVHHPNHPVTIRPPDLRWFWEHVLNLGDCFQLCCEILVDGDFLHDVSFGFFDFGFVDSQHQLGGGDGLDAVAPLRGRGHWLPTDGSSGRVQGEAWRQGRLHFVLHIAAS
mmetsp:Transcript_4656/g.7787  ORF Transcript_4656/g.7787 Transcript_4656/m.7787 type:complete len:287 (+) Transcript_4656:501-1361(+)